MSISSPAPDRIDLHTPRRFECYPGRAGQIPPLDAAAGRYRLRFARNRSDLDAVLRLRFDVFNVELCGGLDRAFLTARDEDEFDASMHHLMVTCTATGEVVGTYRVQTGCMARSGGGFYSAGEFELDGLPGETLDDAVEVGRACVAKDHRNGRVLRMLWRGLAAYLTWNGNRYLFGCCSLPTLDAAAASVAYGYLSRLGRVHPTIRVAPVPSARCVADVPSAAGEPCEIPPLFESYLRLGAKVCSPPAIDPLFKTIDFLVVLDVNVLDPRTHQTFFQERRPA